MAPTRQAESAAFVPNQGQWAHAGRYVAAIGATTVFLDERGWTLSFAEGAGEHARGVVLRMRFVDAARARLAPGARLAGVYHYFLGNDPGRWRTDVPRYGEVTYRDLYPGVDVRAYEKGGRFEYDLMLAPGADLTRVEIEVEGATGLRVDDAGALVATTAAGLVRQIAGLTYEIDRAGERHALAAQFEVRGSSRFGFAVPGWNGERSMVIDPGVVWSTFVGHSLNEGSSSLAVDAGGRVTITGYTMSPGYPTTPGAWDTTHNSVGVQTTDVFVTCLDPSLPPAQQLVYSTFVGGDAEDYGYALAVDAAGVVTITGWTSSSNYPTTNGSSAHGGSDAIVTCLDPSQSGAQQLVFSTYLGGSADDQGYAVAIDATWGITVAGMTGSADYPTTPNAWDTTHDGLRDVFVARIDPALPPPQQLVYSTFVGGEFSEEAYALAVDSSGVVTAAGHTNSPTFPTTPGAFDVSYNGTGDGFAFRLDPARPMAQQLVASTFVGGVDNDWIRALSLDPTSDITLVGESPSLNYPVTQGAWDTSQNGGNDVVVTRFDSSLTQLLYSTFLGGVLNDYGRAIGVDSAGVITIAGHSISADYPTTPGAWDTTHNSFAAGAADVVVTRLDPTRSSAAQVLYSTFVGGNDLEYLWGLGLDAAGGVTIAGSTYSRNYPTTFLAWNPTHNGGQDVFVTRLDMLPTGVQAFGDSSPGCAGLLAASVTSMPRVGNQAFAITSTNAPPFGPGLLVLAGAKLTSPIPIFGMRLWLDPFGALFLPLNAQANAQGAASSPLPIPANVTLAGGRLDVQSFWFGPTAPTPCPPIGWSASFGLEITIQP